MPARWASLTRRPEIDGRRLLVDARLVSVGAVTDLWSMVNESNELSRLSGHGGRVYEAARRWGIDPDEVVDFSANINPLGAPPGVIAALNKSLAPIVLRTYPDQEAFVSAVADRHQVEPRRVLVGNGTAALLFALLRALWPARVLL